MFGGVFVRRFLDERPQELAIRFDPVRLHVPFLAVPLLKLHGARAFVIGARNVDRRQQAGRAQLRYPLIVEVEVLEAPLDLLPAERMFSEMILRDAERFDVQDAVDDAERVIAAADTALIL